MSVVVALGAALVAAGVALLLSNTLALRNSNQSTTRAEAYLLRVVDLERLVVDAETGLRGDVITGNALFLAPLHSAQAQVPSAIAALQDEALDDHAYLQRSNALIQSVRSYMSVYVRDVVALAAFSLPAARTFEVTLQGKQRVDAIRGKAAALERLLSESEATRERAAGATANRSITEAIIVLALLTLLTVGVGGYLARLAVARDRAREQSERTSRTLQESILPSSVPAIPGCELATRFIPGGELVSGDFYDVLEVEPGGWALMIGDVTGKGAAAAAATAVARWTLRSSLTLGATPADALRFLNDVVLRQEREGRFITAVCMTLTLEPECARVAVACAGHPAPILVPRVGPPVPVAADGDLLGMGQPLRLHTAEVQLRIGDSLVAYTDGVTDQGPETRPSPEEALRDRSVGAGAEALAAKLEGLAHNPAGRPPDDIAILVLRFLGEREGEPRPHASVGEALR